MYSKNNTKMMMQKNRPTKQRFGLRKLSVGVASVLLGLSWTYASTASADTTTNEAAVVTEVVKSTTVSADNGVSQNGPINSALTAVSLQDSDTSIASGSIGTNSEVMSTQTEVKYQRNQTSQTNH